MPTEYVIEFTPAFDKRDPDPHKNYGIHGVNLTFVIKGDEGVVSFVLYTGWQLPHVRNELLDSSRVGQTSAANVIAGAYHSHMGIAPILLMPQPADLGYHSPKPLRDWQTDSDPSYQSCQYLGGAPCWYDGSGLAAERVFDRLCAEGDEGVWSELRDYYYQTYGVEVSDD